MESRTAAIGALLAKYGREVGGDRPGEWRVDLGNGVPFPARARLRGNWLELAAPIAPEPGDGPWTLLELNGALRGPARVVDTDDGLALRADVPVHGRQALADRLLGAFESMRRWHGEARELPLNPAAAPLDDAERGQWIATAAESGRDITVRPDGLLAVALPVPGRDGQARIGLTDGEALAAVRVTHGGPLDPATLDAMGVFLLRGTGALRLVRAAVRRGAGREPDAAHVVLEVPMPRLVDGVELDAALSALTVASRHCAREARALTDVRLARAYLDHTTKEADRAIR